MKLVYTKVANKFLNVFNGSLLARPAFERLELFKPIKKILRDHQPPSHTYLENT